MRRSNKTSGTTTMSGQIADSMPPYKDDNGGWLSPWRPYFLRVAK